MEIERFCRKKIEDKNKVFTPNLSSTMPEKFDSASCFLRLQKQLQLAIFVAPSLWVISPASFLFSLDGNSNFKPR